MQYSDPLRAGGSLAVVDPASGTLTDIHTPFTSFGSLSVAQVCPCVASCALPHELMTCTYSEGVILCTKIDRLVCYSMLAAAQ